MKRGAFLLGGGSIAELVGRASSRAARTVWHTSAREDARPTKLSHYLVLLLTAAAVFGCRTAPLPPADFSAPGWRVRQGQAVWKPSSSRPELAGDLLFATNANGNFFVQFSKIPFPLATAQISGDQWQIEFGANEFSWHGSGTPPDRFAWFQLPRALLGANVSDNWKFIRVETNSWCLENPHTGEILEGEFFP